MPAESAPEATACGVPIKTQKFATFPKKHQKMNDFGTIVDLVFAPKIDQKSTLFFVAFGSPSKNGVATILTSKTSPKWNQIRALFENRRPCDFAAIYYTFERFCTFGRVKNRT